MKVYISTKKYFKEKPEIQRGIITGINALYSRIRQYEQQKIPFNKIFNDDSVIYDKHGRFFVFKCKNYDNQLRILYTYLIIDGEAVFLVADYVVKKRTNKQYLRDFDAYNKTNPFNILATSTQIIHESFNNH